MKKILTILVLQLFVFGAYAQTAIIQSVDNPSVCSGTSTTVRITQTAAYGVGNTFTIQMSDENGDFSTFTNIGAVAGTLEDSIVITTPSTTPSSQNYKLRILTTNPFGFSAEFGPFTIDQTPGVPWGKGIVDKRDILEGDVVEASISPWGGDTSLLYYDVFVTNQDDPTVDDVFRVHRDSTKQYIANKAGSTSFEFIAISNLADCRSNGGLGNQEIFRIDVYSCTPKVPASANVITLAEDFGRDEHWICPGGAGNSTLFFDEVYMEQFSSVILNNNNGATAVAYMKPNTSLTGVGFNSEIGVAIVESGMNTSGISADKFLTCPVLTFDYTEAPTNGCPGIITGQEEEITSVMEIAPNPSNDKVSITLPFGELSKLTLVDALGRIVEMQAASVVDVSGLDAGIYHLTVETVNGQLFQEKLVVE